MSIQDLGAIGELVSAIVVVITLIYLSIQLKQNTFATQANVTAAVALEMERALLSLAENADLADAYLKALQDQTLPPDEKIRLGFWWAAFVRSAHSHVTQDKLGNLTENNTETASHILRYFVQTAFFRERLEEMVATKQYPEDFCNWLRVNVLHSPVDG